MIKIEITAVTREQQIIVDKNKEVTMVEANVIRTIDATNTSKGKPSDGGKASKETIEDKNEDMTTDKAITRQNENTDK